MKTEAKIQAMILFASLFLAATFCLAQPPAQPAQKKNPATPPPVKEEPQSEEQVLKLGTTQIVLNVTVTNASDRRHKTRRSNQPAAGRAVITPRFL